MKASTKRANDELKKVKDAENNIKKDREKAMKDMEQQVKTVAKSASTLKTEVSKLKNKRDALSAELSGLTKEMMSIKEQITASESSLAKLMKEAEILNDKLEDRKRAHELAKQALDQKQQELNACSKEIKALVTAREKCLKAVQAASLEARKVQHKILKWEKDFKEAKDNMKALLKQHPWIEKERSFFGVSGSDFDFAAKDVTQAASRFNELKAEQVSFLFPLFIPFIYFRLFHSPLFTLLG